MEKIDPQVTDAMKTLYGNNGNAWFNKLVEQHPGVDPARLIAEYQEQPTPLFTNFFRESNLEKLTRIAQIRHEESDNAPPFKIAQIGVSTGEETWSLAALLTASKTPFKIDAFEISARALQQTTQPYRIAKTEFDRQLTHVPQCHRYFSWTSEGVLPSPELAANVTFKQSNILLTPLPSNAYDAVVINNVLWHFPRDVRNIMTANTLYGLKEKGRFMCEGMSRSSIQNPDYIDWLKTLSSYGLYALHGETERSGIRRYWPDWGGKRSRERIQERLASLRTPSKEIIQALGVVGLATTDQTLAQVYADIAQAEATLPFDDMHAAYQHTNETLGILTEVFAGDEVATPVLSEISGIIADVTNILSLLAAGREDLQTYRGAITTL